MNTEKQFYTEPQYWESLVTQGEDYPYPKYLLMLKEQKKRDWAEFREMIDLALKQEEAWYAQEPCNGWNEEGYGASQMHIRCLSLIDAKLAELNKPKE